MLVQVIAVAVTCVYSFVVTFVMLKILDRTMGLNVSPEDESSGPDVTQHGEQSYQL